jgi:ELWxxDGT repeat protein
VLFNGVDSAITNALWVTNGTVAGTHEITGIAGTSANGLNPEDMTVFKNEVLLAGTDAANQLGLWVTDGTAAGTHELSGISGAYAGGIFATHFPPSFTIFNGEVLFEGTDANGQVGLWVTNGTVAGTHELTDIKGANTSGAGLNPESLTTLKGEVLFRGVDANGEVGLWVTNGTSAGTHEITNISGAFNQLGGLNPVGLTVVSLSNPKNADSLSLHPGLATT